MAWDFLKKLVGNRESAAKAAAAPPPVVAPPVPAVKAPEPVKAPEKTGPAAAPPAPAREKTPEEKTDDELVAELDKISPQILAQARAPQQRALIISIYRKMLIAKVDINDDREVKKWMKNCA